MRQADRTLELLEVDEAKYADDLSQQQKEFASTLNTLTTALLAVQNQQDMAKLEEIAAQVSSLHQQLRSASKEAVQINTRESLLGQPVSDYSQVKQLSDMFDPFLQFWTTAAAWKVSVLSSGRCKVFLRLATSKPPQHPYHNDACICDCRPTTSPGCLTPWSGLMLRRWRRRCRPPTRCCTR